MAKKMFLVAMAFFLFATVNPVGAREIFTPQVAEGTWRASFSGSSVDYAAQPKNGKMKLPKESFSQTLRFSGFKLFKGFTDFYSGEVKSPENEVFGIIAFSGNGNNIWVYFFPDDPEVEDLTIDCVPIYLGQLFMAGACNVIGSNWDAAIREWVEKFIISATVVMQKEPETLPLVPMAGGAGSSGKSLRQIVGDEAFGEVLRTNRAVIRDAVRKKKLGL